MVKTPLLQGLGLANNVEERLNNIDMEGLISEFEH